jgi:glycosyltransferase involved in cell wall biosynthesis
MKLAPATLVPVPAAPARTRHVLVDMTPLGPHGQNGGAGLVASALVKHLSALAPDLELTLLTSPASHAELVSLEAANVRRRCVSATAPTPSAVGRTLANRLLPPQARVRLKRVYWSLRKERTLGRLTEALRPDLLLCPFTVPYFWRPGVPCVSIVYDLQHLTYPDFFTPEQRLNRQRHIEDACARSDRVVCISEYVRATLLARVDVRPERVATISLGLIHDFGGAHTDIVERLGLSRAEFLLYPANFWPHKNHMGLFEALLLYHQNHPDSRLKLVCTGAPGPQMATLAGAAHSLLPPGMVVFAGYVAEEALDTLLQACAAVIFPSLYEGFGMPVVEAMAQGKPVLCSNTTSLPEVAGDAAVYFDPTQPQQIASAIESLADVVRIDDLVRRGRGRAAAMGGGRDMARRYLDLLRQVLAAAPPETCSVSR